MSKETKVFCDRCKKEITGYIHAVTIRDVKDDASYPCDLCFDCFRHLFDELHIDLGSVE